MIFGIYVSAATVNGKWNVDCLYAIRIDKYNDCKYIFSYR